MIAYWSAPPCRRRPPTPAYSFIARPQRQGIEIPGWRDKVESDQTIHSFIYYVPRRGIICMCREIHSLSLSLPSRDYATWQTPANATTLVNTKAFVYRPIRGQSVNAETPSTRECTANEVCTWLELINVQTETSYWWVRRNRETDVLSTAYYC